MPLPVTVQGVGVTLDLLLWRAYGRRGQTPAMLAAALALNPDLAGLGPELPLLTPVRLPDLPSGRAATRRRIVNLWED